MKKLAGDRGGPDSEAPSMSSRIELEFLLRLVPISARLAGKVSCAWALLSARRVASDMLAL